MIGDPVAGNSLLTAAAHLSDSGRIQEVIMRAVLGVPKHGRIRYVRYDFLFVCYCHFLLNTRHFSITNNVMTLISGSDVTQGC